MVRMKGIREIKWSWRWMERFEVECRVLNRVRRIMKDREVVMGDVVVDEVRVFGLDIGCIFFCFVGIVFVVFVLLGGCSVSYFVSG